MICSSVEVSSALAAREFSYPSPRVCRRSLPRIPTAATVLSIISSAAQAGAPGLTGLGSSA